MHLLSKPKRFSFAVLCLVIFWYVSQFPGRLGFDNSEIIRMLRAGRSTDWWSSEFFWYVKIFSFDGRFIFLLSALQAALLTFYLSKFIRIFIEKKNVQNFVIVAAIANPIFGNMAVNVSHDTFIVIGILSIVTDNITYFRNKQASTSESNLNKIMIFVGLVSLTFSSLGKIILVSQVIFLVLTRRMNFRNLGNLALVAALSLTTFVNVDHYDKTHINQLLVFDLKCIAQHEQAEISDLQWSTLESFAPRDEWKTPVSCKLGDAQIAVMPNLNYRNLGKLTGIYFELLKQNPAIVLQAHFQRASQALPPPFFFGPENQVVRDPNIPVGLGSNNALQQGTELLHPSVDEPTVNIKVKIFYPFEVVAQTLMFIVNQASWFWGWGGLWLYPILTFYILKGRLNRIIPELFPIAILHLSLLVIGPGPFGRYVLTTILIGYILLTAQLYEFITKKKMEQNP